MALDRKMGTSRRKSGNDLAESYPISVIIPVFNGAGFLGRTLEAALDARRANVEVIVVDDASTDSTAEMLANHPRHEEFSLVRVPLNLGPAGARNLGAEKAAHPYLFFLDADIELPESTIEWLRDSLDLYSHRPEIAGVLGCYSDRASGESFLSRLKNLETAFLYRITDTLSPFLHTAMLLIRRDIFELAGGFDGNLRKAEDFRLGVILGSRGFRFVIDRRIKGRHLKEIDFRGLLREDWARIRSLLRIPMTPSEKRFSIRAHRFGRIVSLLLPVPIVALLLASIPLGWQAAVPAFLLVALFFLCNLRFLRFIRLREGLWFSMLTFPVLFFEMLWATAAVTAARLSFRRLSTVPPSQPTQTEGN